MRLIMLTTFPVDMTQGSGTALSFISIRDGLKARGFDITTPYPQFINDDYVGQTFERFLYNMDLRDDPAMRDADLIFAYDYDGFALRPGERIPLVVSPRVVFADIIETEPEPFHSMLRGQALMENRNLHNADRIVTNSQFSRGRVVQHYGIAPEKIQVIPNGVDIPAMRALMAAPLRQPSAEVTVIAVAKMYPRKRIDVLVRAIGLLAPRYPNLRLHVLGDGFQFENLQRLGVELGLESVIKWEGFVADRAVLAQHYRNADIFCQPSHQDSFSNVFLEAMSAGLPITAVDAGASREIIGDAGFIAPPENPQALADIIEPLVRDEALRREYGQRAAQRLENFSISRTLDLYTALFHEIARK